MKLKTSDNSFFNNDSTQKPNDSTQKPDAETAAQPARMQEVKSQEKSHSVIGENIKFRGELIGTENIHIEGTIEGTIIMKGHNLSVGSQGVIDANIHANNITINGKLTGDILADELISIKKSAEVKGNLIAPRIQLDDGGKFRGSMDMIDNDQDKKSSTEAFEEKLIHPHLPAKSGRKRHQHNSSNKQDSKNNNTVSAVSKDGTK